MNVVVAGTKSIKKTFDYKGRSRRSEFWGFLLFSFLTCFLLGFFDEIFFGASWPFIETITYSNGEVVGHKYSMGINYGPISNTCSLIFLIPFLSAMVRRLHDAGRSGLFLLLPLAPSLIMSVLVRSQQLQYVLIFGIIFLLIIIFMIFLFFKDSDYNNKYGISEKYPKDEAVANPMKDS